MLMTSSPLQITCNQPHPAPTRQQACTVSEAINCKTICPALAPPRAWSSL
jgi:hypothetical protein